MIVLKTIIGELMGQIKKLHSGKYKVDVIDKAGKRFRYHFDKRNEASAFVNRIETEKAESRLVKKGLIKEKISIDAAINSFMESKYQLADSSLKKYKNIIHQFQNFTDLEGVINIDGFTRDHADKFMNILINSDAKAKTINSYLITVKAIFELQVVKDIIIKNPFSHIENLRIKKKTLLEREQDYYNDNEINSFFSQVMETVYRNAFLGLFLTGTRFEEMASLKWEFVVFESDTIQIRSTQDFTTKTVTSERDIPMTPLLKGILIAAKAKSNSEYVFPSKNNMKMSERTLLQVCKRVAENANIKKKATLHKWRHTYASLCQQIGVPYEDRQYLLGHKPKSMTEHYTKVDPKKLHQRLNELDDYLPKTKGTNDNNNRG